MLASVNYGICTTGNQNPHAAATDRQSFMQSSPRVSEDSGSSALACDYRVSKQQQQQQRFCCHLVVTVTAGVLLQEGGRGFRDSTNKMCATHQGGVELVPGEGEFGSFQGGLWDLSEQKIVKKSYSETRPYGKSGKKNSQLSVSMRP